MESIYSLLRQRQRIVIGEMWTGAVGAKSQSRRFPDIIPERYRFCVLALWGDLCHLG